MVVVVMVVVAEPEIVSAGCSLWWKLSPPTCLGSRRAAVRSILFELMSVKLLSIVTLITELDQTLITQVWTSSNYLQNYQPILIGMSGFYHHMLMIV